MGVIITLSRWTIMSKTAKQKKTKGFLDRIATDRKERQLIRCMKADSAYCEWDISPRNRTFQSHYAA